MSIGKISAYIVSGLLFGFVLILIFADRVDTNSADDSGCKRDSLMAAVMSQRFVEKQLRSPSTASFPSQPDRQSYVDTCTWEVLSYVDAQNAFGATARTRYFIMMHYDPETKLWSGRDLRM